MANSIHEVFLVYSADHRQLRSVSPTYEEIWGRSCDSLYQEPMAWMEALHPEDRERMEAADRPGHPYPAPHPISWLPGDD